MPPLVFVEDDTVFTWFLKWKDLKAAKRASMLSFTYQPHRTSTHEELVGNSTVGRESSHPLSFGWYRSRREADLISENGPDVFHIALVRSEFQCGALIES